MRRARRLPSLDGLRALAVFLVCLGHLGGTRHFITSAAMARVGDVGNLGVRIFFVISGFLITHLLLVERGRTGRISLKAFYIRRALRILPAFYVFLGTAALLTLFGVLENDRGDFIHALTYTMNYRGMTDHFSLRHLWSLSVEEQFYLLWPAVVVVCSTRGAGRVPDALATGAALAIAFPRLERTRWFDKLISSRALPLLFVVVWLANRATDHPHFFWAICIPVMNVAIALLIARYVRHPHLPLAKLFNTAPAVAIGTLSYSLYLWQELFLIQWRSTTSVLQQFPFNLVAACACALVSYAVVEQPFLRLKTRFGSAGPAGPQESATNLHTDSFEFQPARSTSA